jgi:hypothetical protein
MSSNHGEGCGEELSFNQVCVQLRGIKKPHHNDVLCGRGGASFGLGKLQ